MSDKILIELYEKKDSCFFKNTIFKGTVIAFAVTGVIVSTLNINSVYRLESTGIQSGNEISAGISEIKKFVENENLETYKHAFNGNTFQNTVGTTEAPAVNLLRTNPFNGLLVNGDIATNKVFMFVEEELIPAIKKYHSDKGILPTKEYGKFLNREIDISLLSDYMTIKDVELDTYAYVLDNEVQNEEIAISVYNGSKKIDTTPIDINKLILKEYNSDYVTLLSNNQEFKISRFERYKNIIFLGYKSGTLIPEFKDTTKNQIFHLKN